MAQQSPRGVQVDSDARRMSDPVTVVVWPSGMEQDADTWSDANNYLSAGAGIKPGHPAGPEITLNADSMPAPGAVPAEQPRPTPAAIRPSPAPAQPPASS